MNLGFMKIEFIGDAKLFYRQYSFWFFVILGLLPDIYNQAVTYGIITADQAPVMLARVMNIIAFGGIVARNIKQAGLAAAAAQLEEEKETK